MYSFLNLPQTPVENVSRAATGSDEHFKRLTVTTEYITNCGGESAKVKAGRSIVHVSSNVLPLVGLLTLISKVMAKRKNNENEST